MKKIQLLLIAFFCTSTILFAQGKIQRLYVNSKLGDCKSELFPKCFQIKNSLSQKKWKNYIGEIREFDYAEGFIYKLRVKKIVHEVPPAEGIKFYYTLVKVLSKTPVESTSDIQLVNKKYYFTEYSDEGAFVKPTIMKSFIQFDVAGKSFSGNDGCNGFFGKLKKITTKKIKFGAIAGTMMACPDMGNSDFKIKTLFAKVNAYTLDGNHLSLMHGNTVLLKCTLSDISPQ